MFHQCPNLTTHSIRVLAPRTHHTSKTLVLAVTLDDESVSDKEPPVPPMSSVTFREYFPSLARPNRDMCMAVRTHVVAAYVVGSGQRAIRVELEVARVNAEESIGWGWQLDWVWAVAVTGGSTAALAPVS
jgi:hypothetical protein